MKTKLPYTLFGGYRWFSSYWWKDVLKWVTTYWREDLKHLWHRGRYGWAPRDCWNADTYIAKVWGEMLLHLAEHSNGAPAGYPKLSAGLDTPTDYEQWRADLRRWGTAFTNYATENYYELHGSNHAAWHEDETQRIAALHTTLREIEPWFTALWN